jgi:hypothetical protein
MTPECLPHQVRPAGPRSDHDAVLASCGLPWAWALLRPRRSRLVRATHRARSFDGRDGSHHPRVRCGAADGLRWCSMARLWPVGTVACTQQHGWALRWALGAEVGAGRCTGWHRARRTRHDTMPCAWGVMQRARSRVGTRGAAPGITHRHAHACVEHAAVLVGPSRSSETIDAQTVPVLPDAVWVCGRNDAGPFCRRVWGGRNTSGGWLSLRVSAIIIYPSSFRIRLSRTVAVTRA